MQLLTRRSLRSLAGGLGSLIAIGLAAALLSEALLQAGAWWVRTSSQQTASSWRTGSLRILCVGDSNTYGVYLDDRNDAWPARLEALWNGSGRAPRIEVMNLGYPGTSSSLLLRHLPELLETFEPDLLLVMVGANDFWTLPTPIDRERDASFSLWRFIEQHSRLHRLIYLAVQSADQTELVVDTSLNFPTAGKGSIVYGDRSFAMEYRAAPDQRADAVRGLSAGLAAIAAAAAEARVRLALLTYPSRRHDYARANESIRRVAREEQVMLIDLAADFAGICPDETCEALFVPDQHPNQEGYEVAAGFLAERLAGLLAALSAGEEALARPQPTDGP